MAEDPTSPKSDSSEDTRRYWEHLDAKFAAFNTPSASKPEPVRKPDPPSEPALPPVPEPAASTERVPVPLGERQRASGLIAEAFGALLAFEDGLPGARPVRLAFDDKTAAEKTAAEQLAPPAPVEPAITDAMIEDVVRRVIEKMAPDAIRALVADIVSETAERLVKEEIDRIRNQHV
jgi:hypothetical protein